MSLKKDKDGNLLFLVHNSGSGLSYHQRESDTKLRYHPIKAFKIPKTGCTIENLTYFLTELVKARTEFTLKDVDVIKNDNTIAKRLYGEVFGKIAYLDGFEIDPKEVNQRLGEVLIMGQRSGTCSEKVLHEVLKSSLSDDRIAKSLIFNYKKYSIETFYRDNKDSMDYKKREQLSLAIENLSRAVGKNPNLLPENSIQETFEKLNAIKDEIKEIKVPPTHKSGQIVINKKELKPQGIAKFVMGKSLVIQDFYSSGINPPPTKPTGKVRK